MKKVKVVILTTVCMVAVGTVWGCGKKNDGENKSERKLSIYLLEESPFIETIDTYNKQNSNAENQIEYTLFPVDEYENMYKKITNELLAGEGPDLFYFDISSAVNINALANQGAFWDLERVGLNLPYENISIDHNGILPVSYTLPLLFTTKDLCEQYGIDTDEIVLSEETLSRLAENNIPVLAQPYAFLDNIYENFVDDTEKNSSYNSEEFKKIFSNLETWKSYDIEQDMEYYGLNTQEYKALQKGEIMFMTSYMFSSPMDIVTLFNKLKKESGKEVEIFGVANSNTADQIRGWANEAVAVNAGSDKKDEAKQFVEYVLSDEVQGCTEEGYRKVMGIPVLKESRENEIEMMTGVPYKENYTDIETGVTEELQSKYIKIFERVSECSIQDNVYKQDIFDEELEKYKAGKIDKNKFIEELDKKTKLYLNE